MLCLEAIRGVAAFVVVLSHLTLMLRPTWCLAVDSLPPIESLIANTPLRLFFDGPFAVRIFFVLSGIVLSMAFFRNPAGKTLGSSALRRYPRLALPAAASIAFAFLLLRGGYIYNSAAADTLGQPANAWLRSLYSFAPSIMAALREAASTGFSNVSLSQSYNCVLWTMSIEMQGSLLVYAWLALFGRMRNRWLIYIAAVLLMRHYQQLYMIDFLCGIWLCDLYVARRLTLPTPVGVALITLGLFVGPLRAEWLQAWGWSTFARGLGYCPSVGALLIIAGTLGCVRIQQLLNGRIMSWLGRISFSLYLVHLPVICSVGAWVFVSCYNGSPMLATALTILVSVACSLTLAHILAFSVESWSIVLPKKAIVALFLDRDDFVAHYDGARYSVGIATHSSSELTDSIKKWTEPGT